MQVYLTLLGYTPSNRPTAGECWEIASLFVDELCLKVLLCVIFGLLLF